MSKTMRMLSIAGVLTAVAAHQVMCQTPAVEPDPVTVSIQQAAQHIRGMFTVAVDSMNEADFAFRPTKDVRTFGQLLAHVAETNYWFCSTALGETNPRVQIEKTVMERAAIRKALLDSFEYCDRAYAAMSDTARANAIRQFRGGPRPALVLLNFRAYHSLLHWGNAITYMRLRGRVPPSAG